MSWFRMVRVLLTVAAIAVSASYSSVAAAAGKKVLILFDRSGTMTDDPGACAQLTVTPPVDHRKAFCALQSMLSLGKDSLLVNYAPDGAIMSDVDFYFWEFQGIPGQDDIGMFEKPPLNNFTCGGGGNSLSAGNPLPSPPDCLVPFLTGVQTLLIGAGGGSTPLAQAYCRGVTFLKNLQAADPTLTLDLILVSDGEADGNGTLADIATCNGPSSAFPDPPVTSFPPLPYTVVGPDSSHNFFVSTSSAFSDVFLTVGSWQANMLDVAISGGVAGSGGSGLGLPNFGPHPIPATGTTIPGAFQPPAGGSPVLTNVNFIRGFIPPAMSPSRLLAAPVVAAAPTTNDPFLTFLDGLSRSTGGRLTIPSNVSTNGDAFGTHAVAGDINDSGCVDAADFALLKQSFGQKATIFNPAALAADLSLDGTVKDRDYRILRSKFGNGCATPPGPVPTFGNAILSFGDPASWIPTLSTTTLTLSGKSTEGGSGLKVGGVNFREIRSVPFSTTVFGGSVPSTAKMVADLYIPGPPSNPSWLGQAQLLIDCPSAGIHNQYISAVELTGKQLNAFSAMSFPLPANVRAAISTAHSDFTIKLVVNSSDSGQVWDNLRVVP